MFRQENEEILSNWITIISYSYFFLSWLEFTSAKQSILTHRTQASQVGLVADGVLFHVSTRVQAQLLITPIDEVSENLLRMCRPCHLKESLLNLGRVEDQSQEDM